MASIIADRATEGRENVTPHIEDLISHYIDGEKVLPKEVADIVTLTREAASKGRPLEVVDCLRKLRRFRDGAPASTLAFPETMIAN